MYRSCAFCLASLALVVSGAPTVRAEPGSVGGAIIVPVVDQNGTDCINVMKQSVAVILKDLKIQRYSDWLSTSKDVGAKFDVLISPPTGSAAPKFDFPEAVVEKAFGSTDILEVPVNGFRILNNYTFTDGRNNAYTSLGLSFDFINVTDKSLLAKAVLTLAHFTQTVAVPSEPFSLGVSYFGTFFNDLISADSSSADNNYLGFSAEDLYRGVGTCQSTQLHEGTYAVIFDFQKGGLFRSANPPASGIVETADVFTGPGAAPEGQTNYCFFLDGNQLTFAKNQNGVDCTKDGSPRAPLNNPQLVIETVAYDLPTPQAGSTVPALSIKNFSASDMTDLNLSDLASFPKSSRFEAQDTLSDAEEGLSLKDALDGYDNSVSSGQYKPAGEVALSAPESFPVPVTVSTQTALALANLRAAARCRNVGIPITSCTISAFPSGSGSR
jgi:hypothetical protein